MAIVAVCAGAIVAADEATSQPTTAPAATTQPLHVLPGAEIRYRDGTSIVTTRPAWQILYQLSDGTAHAVSYPAAAPAVLPAYLRSIRVGPGEAVRTLEQAAALLRDDTELLFQRGQHFTFDRGLDTNGRSRVRIGTWGTGPRPTLTFRSPKAAGRYPVAVNAGGKGTIVEDLDVRAGDSSSTTGVVASGTGTLVRRVTVAGGSRDGAGFKAIAAVGARFEDCVASGAYYGAWVGPGGGPLHLAAASRDVTFLRCDLAGTADGHGLRQQLTDGLRILDCTVRGLHSRCALTLHERSDTLVEGCVVEGNIGTGAVAQGVYLDWPAGPARDFALGLTHSGVVIRGNRIRLRNASAISLDVGTVAATIEGNTIEAPAGHAVTVAGFDGRYPRRPLASATVRGNVITGPAGTRVFKAPAGAAVTTSGNAVNGQRVD